MSGMRQTDLHYLTAAAVVVVAAANFAGSDSGFEVDRKG